MAGKLWDKGYEPDKMIEEYTVGDDRELDMRLARYDVEGSLAHIAMLETIGLLTAEELEKLTAGLKEIAAEIEAERFEIEPGTEDVHSQVELMLTRRLGDAGKKIHSGRSRNDQVLVDLKLFLRDELRQVADAVKRVFDRLQEQSEKYKEVLMPGYTHLQIAMPSSFGLWFGAYAETLADDMRLVAAAWHIANQNPLGSAAGYGSSFPLDRTMTTRLMGFEELHYNVVAAQMSRGKSERAAAAAIAAVAATIGRLAMDVCLFMSQNFGFVSLPRSRRQTLRTGRRMGIQTFGNDSDVRRHDGRHASEQFRRTALQRHDPSPNQLRYPGRYLVSRREQCTPGPELPATLPEPDSRLANEMGI